MEFKAMAQMKTQRVIVATALLATLGIASVPVFAQTGVPAAPADQGKSMMGREMPGHPDGTMPGMMMNGEMQQKMARMMDNCNRMMESMMPNGDGAAPKKN